MPIYFSKPYYKQLKLTSYILWNASLIHLLFSLHNAHCILAAKLLTIQSIAEYTDLYFINPTARTFITLHHVFMTANFAMWWWSLAHAPEYESRTLRILFLVQIAPILLFRLLVHCKQRCILANKERLLFSQIAIPGIVFPCILLYTVPFSTLFMITSGLIAAIITIIVEMMYMCRVKWNLNVMYTYADPHTGDPVLAPLCFDS